ncbi:rcc01693 family protein [Yoonia sp.]|uniref:rcc01693 family protein n=1 Tax=Yoonia sp. TaxID=2212373 RepID=UPI0035C80A76
MDWRGLMHAGLHQLRLTPADFWALTPVELQVMLGLEGGIAPMGRGQFDALLRDFPDLKRDE